MILPCGITGFFTWGGDPPPPLGDFRAFRSQSYAAARLAGGRVMNAEFANDCRIACNFVYLTVDLPSAEIAVLLNYYFPFIAFSESFEERQYPLLFADAPKIAEGFAAFGVYQVLSASVLNQKITSETLSNLSDGEKKKLRYFEPKTVGELIFNFWD
jgi:hypothetical protein